MASQITSIMIVYSTIYLGANQRKRQGSASLAFAGEFTSDRWIPRTNWRASNAENVSILWRHHNALRFRVVLALPYIIVSIGLIINLR